MLQRWPRALGTSYGHAIASDATSRAFTGRGGSLSVRVFQAQPVSSKSRVLLRPCARVRKGRDLAARTGREGGIEMLKRRVRTESLMASLWAGQQGPDATHFHGRPCPPPAAASGSSTSLV